MATNSYIYSNKIADMKKSTEDRFNMRLLEFLKWSFTLMSIPFFYFFEKELNWFSLFMAIFTLYIAFVFYGLQLRYRKMQGKEIEEFYKDFKKKNRRTRRAIIRSITKNK